MALAQDEATGAGRARAVDTRRDRGVVIYRSDFQARWFDGWTDMWSGGADHARPQGITAGLSDELGERCLMLSTTEEFPVQNNTDPMHDPACFRRMARHDEFRYHSVSGYFALGVGGFSDSWGSWRLMIDTQAWDNSQRSFYQLYCNRSPDGQGYRWQLRGNPYGGAETIHTVAPATGGTFVGNNENKLNEQYVRLTVDLQANGGLGAYHELQVGGFVYDLTNPANIISANPAWVLGSAAEPIQDSANTIDDFRGGDNIGLAISRHRDGAGLVDVAGGCQLFARDIVYSASNAA